MPYVYSTLSCDTAYVVYHDTNIKDIARAKHTVVIKGGANVANRQIVTPKGVVTKVSDEDLEVLMKDKTFLLQKEKGFLTIDNKNINADKIARDMTPKDNSAPKTPDDPEFKGTTKVLGSDTPKKRR